MEAPASQDGIWAVAQFPFSAIAALLSIALLFVRGSRAERSRFVSFCAAGVAIVVTVTGFWQEFKIHGWNCFNDHYRLPIQVLFIPSILGLLVILHLFRQHYAARKSDWGRKFGWFIEKDGRIIGELEYVRWDSDAQFWHDYRVVWRSDEEELISQEAWLDAKAVLRNRRFTDVVIDGFLASPRGDSAVGIRYAHVPEENF